MSSSACLTSEELQFLQENGRFATGAATSNASVQLASLIEHGTSEYLLEVQKALNIDKIDVAASLLMKRLGFLAVNCCLSMTAFNKALKVDPVNIWIDSCFEKDVWLPKIRFNSLHVTVAPEAGREEWRQIYFKELFGEVFAPIIERLAKEARISRQTLWENVMLYVYWLYETILPKLKIRVNREEDFAGLLTASPSIFGMNRNPAASFYKPKTFVDKHQAEIRIRTTCCFYYQANEKGTHCSTCPLNCKVE